MWSALLRQKFCGLNEAAQDGSLLLFTLALMSISYCLMNPVQWHCHVRQPVAGINVVTDLHKSQEKDYKVLKDLLQK